MLIITRKSNETIQIADNVTIRVLAISGSRVELAIDAPHSVQVRRSELPRREVESTRDGQLNDLPLAVVGKPR